jgi:hypothetical protein
MRAREKTLAVLLTAAVAVGITAAATAHDGGHHKRGSITGFPARINQVDLEGYRIVTSYPLGKDTGNAFQQTYAAHTVSWFATRGRDAGGGTFVSSYIALPIAYNMVFVTWLRPDGSASDVFLMNFNTGVVSNVATPSGQPVSLGTVKITRVGMHEIP